MFFSITIRNEVFSYLTNEKSLSDNRAIEAK